MGDGRRFLIPLSAALVGLMASASGSGMLIGTAQAAPARSRNEDDDDSTPLLLQAPGETQPMLLAHGSHKSHSSHFSSSGGGGSGGGSSSGGYVPVAQTAPAPALKPVDAGARPTVATPTPPITPQAPTPTAAPTAAPTSSASDPPVKPRGCAVGPTSDESSNAVDALALVALAALARRKRDG